MGNTRKHKIEKLRNLKFLINIVASTSPLILMIFTFGDTSSNPKDGWWDQRSEGQIILLWGAVSLWVVCNTCLLYSRFRRFSESDEEEILGVWGEVAPDKE